MKDLIKEYNAALEETKRSLAASTDEGEKKTYRSMISDLEYAVEWMETEREPGSWRDVDRRSYYQHTIQYLLKTGCLTPYLQNIMFPNPLHLQ